MNPLISIIIPIYNVELFIHKCIKSVITQTYINLEIILVNDGSPDNCPIICDEYALSDNRIIVIHKENGGLSDARNAGLDIAKGEYIVFIDSDDYVSKDYIEYLYRLIIKYGSFISVCGLCKINDGSIVYSTKPNTELLLNPQDALESMLYQKYFDTSACAKMYRKELFNNIRYPKGKLFEDIGTTYRLFDASNMISFGSEEKYYYMVRKNSITTNSFNLKKFDLIDMTRQLLDFVIINYPDLALAAVRRYAYVCFELLGEMMNTKPRFYNEENFLITEIKKYAKNIINDKKASLKDKLRIVCIYFGKYFYKIIWNLYINIFMRVSLNFHIKKIYDEDSEMIRI